MFLVRLLVLCFSLGSLLADSPPPPPPPVEHQVAPPLPQVPQVPALPSSQQMTDSYHYAFIRMLLSLLGLLVLVIGTFWVLKRISKGKFRFGSHKAIQILEKRSLSPKTLLYIVEIEGKQILLSESQLEVRSLSTLEPKAD